MQPRAEGCREWNGASYKHEGNINPSKTSRNQVSHKHLRKYGPRRVPIRCSRPWNMRMHAYASREHAIITCNHHIIMPAITCNHHIIMPANHHAIITSSCQPRTCNHHAIITSSSSSCNHHMRMPAENMQSCQIVQNATTAQSATTSKMPCVNCRERTWSPASCIYR